MTAVFELFGTIMTVLAIIGFIGGGFAGIVIFAMTGGGNLWECFREFNQQRKFNRKIFVRGISKLAAIPVIVFAFSVAAVVTGEYPSKKDEIAECDCAEETK